MKYAVIYESCNGDVRSCELITEDYDKAVGFIENSIYQRKKYIEHNNDWLKDNGNENDIEEIVGVNRYDGFDYHELWVLELKFHGEIEKEMHYLYYYQGEENDANEK